MVTKTNSDSDTSHTWSRIQIVTHTSANLQISISKLNLTGQRDLGKPLGLHTLGPPLLWEGYRETFDQSAWCLMFLFNQAWISLLHFPEPRAKRKTVLKVKCFKEAFLGAQKVVWSAGARPKGGSRREPLDDPWAYLSKSLLRLSSLRVFKEEFPSLSQMADL